MADDAVKELVATLKLDVSGWDDAVKEARTVLSDADSEDKARVASSKAASADAISAIKEQVAAQEVLKATSQAQAAAEQTKAEAAKTQAAIAKSSADASVAASAQQTAAERAKLAATESTAAVAKAASDKALASTREQAAATQAAHTAKMAAMQEEAGVLAKEIAERNLNIKKIQEEVAATRAKFLEEQNAAREGKKEPGGISGLLGGSLKTIAGGESSLGGSLVGGLLEGAAGGAAFLALSEGLTMLTEKIKDFVEDSGGLQKVLETFTKLNEMKFGDNGSEFLEQLESSTDHLVQETDLLRNANTYMTSGLNITKTQMLELTKATVGLARGQGKDATDAVNALTRAFLSGGNGVRTLSRLIGIDLPRNVAAGLGPLATYAQKNQASFDSLYKSIMRVANAPTNLGAPALTYSDRLKQIQIASTDIFEGLAQGAVHSTGFDLIMKQIGDMIDSMGDAKKEATSLGEKIGNAFTPVVTILKTVGPVFSLVKQLIVDVSNVVTNLLSQFGILATSSNPIEQNFAKLHPVVNLLAKSFAVLAGLIADTVNGLDLIVNIAQKLPKTFGDPRASQSPGESKTYSKLLENYQDRSDSIAKNIYGAADNIGGNYQDALAAEKKREEDLKKQKGKHPPTPDPSDPAAARREQLAEAKANLDAKKKLSDADFAETKEHIQEETDANEELYKDGTHSAEQYYNTKKKLAAETLRATLDHIQAESDAQRAQLTNNLKLGQISPITYGIEVNAQNSEDRKQRAQAQSTYGKEISGASIGETAEQSREQIALITAELEAKKSAIAAQTEAVKNSYTEQLSSGKEYLDQSVALIQANLQATVEAEAKKQDTGLKPEQLEASLKTQQKAYDDAYKALEQLDDHFTQEVLSNTQKRFSNITGTLQTTQEINSAEGGNAASPSSQLANLQQQRSATDAQIESLEALLSTTKQYSDTWFQIYDAILAATSQTQKLADQMQQLSSYSNAAGNVLSSFAKNTSGVFTSKYGRGFESAIAGAGESLSTSQQQVQGIFGKKTPEVDKLKPYIDATSEATQGLIQSAKGSSSGLDSFSSSIKSAKDILVQALDDLANKIKEVVSPGSTATGALDTKNTSDLAFSPSAITSTTPAVPVLLSPSATPIGVPSETGVTPSVGSIVPSESNLTGSEDEGASTMPDATTAAKGLGDTFLDLSKKVSSAIGAIGGFIGSITSAQSASAGAFGGGASGAGLGQAVGTSLGGPSGPLSSLGSFAGPFGALIGAGIGAALGGIMGQKQEEVTDDITALNVSMKNIQSEFSSNNASLQQTVASIQALIQQAQADEASSKKGGTQFTDLITQYNEQIQQLQDQAEQTMSQMQQQLDVITSPEPFQGLLSSIQSVIQQYTQFAGAAQNATDLANANQFLATSLANIGEQYTETLQQDEISAINDALQLNDLYTQRNALQLQFLQSTEQIMGQGTLTRQLTQSQQKFSQLYTLDVNHQNQLDQLDQQIDVEQYKVQAEQQIFNLATTKAGLEQQSLILQEQGINLDMSRISAMQQLLATLSQSGYSITNLGGVDTSNPNALMQLLLSLLLGQLGISGNNVLSSTGTLVNPGGGALDNQVAGAYASRAQYGYAAFRGNNL